MTKLISIFLCACMVLTLGACSNRLAANSTTTSYHTTTTTESATTENSATTTTITDLITTITTTQTEINAPDDFAGLLEDEDITLEETWENENTVIVDMVVPTKPVITRPIITPSTTTTAVKPTTTTARPTTVADPTTTATKPTTTTKKPSTTTTANPTTTTVPPTTTTTTQATTTTTIKPTTPAKPTYSYTSNQKHTALPYTERYLYSMLDEQWKECYRRIDKAVRNLDETVEFDIDVTENRGYAIYHLYMFDTPELFYLSAGVCTSKHGDGTSSFRFSYSVSNQKGEYCGYGYGPLTDELRQKIRSKKAIFDAEVQRIVSTIPADAPDVVKEKLIYDRILLDSYYNLNAQWDGLANDNWTAYGILVNKYGVCESYAEAFQTLCNAVGINCTGIVGTAGGGHKWNAVQIEGEWYQCDITFDDPIGGSNDYLYHSYFNLTSKEMTQLNHDWSRNEWPVPDCTATKYSYKSYFC